MPFLRLLTSCILVGAACGPSSSQSSFNWELQPALRTPDAGQVVQPGPVNQPAPAPPQAGNAIRFEPWFVTDPQANNVTAITWLAPTGWQGEGSVQWWPEWRRLAFLQTRVTDPNSGLTVEWLPTQDFIFFDPPAGLPQPPIGGNYQGKAYVPPATDPAQFVADFWMPGMLAHLRGATVVGIDQVPAVANELVRQYGGPATASAFRIRYQFNQNGQAWEEDVFFAWLLSGLQPPPILWNVTFAYTVRAPLGMLDAKQGVISTIVSSRTSTPEWEGVYGVVGQLFTQGLQQQIADTQAFGQLLAQHRAESQALQDQVVQERQASQDRIAELRSESLKGIQNLVNPFDNKIVQMPADWNTYWVNRQGEYIVSDQVNFDPNQDPQLGPWERLQPR